jgi:ParB family chromosome partitioning protein
MESQVKIPKRLGETSKIGEELFVLRTLIRPFPNQPRKYFNQKELKSLAESIREHGQLTPAPVLRVKDGKHEFELIDGQRRWHAISMAGHSHMKVTVKDNEEIIDEFGQFKASVISNFGRADHTPIEIAEAIKRFQSWGQNLEQISKIFVKSIPWICQHLRILKLTPEVLEMMSPDLAEEEQLTYSVAVDIAGLPENHQLSVARIIIQKNMSLNVARSFIRDEIQRIGICTKKRKRSPHDDYRNLKNLTKRTDRELTIFSQKPQDFFDLLFLHRSEEDPINLGQTILKIEEHLNLLKEKINTSLANIKRERQTKAGL